MKFDLAPKIVLQESDRLITDSSLQISLKEITVEGVQNILKPETLATTYREKAPFVFNILHTFAVSPNPYRKQQARVRFRGGVFRCQGVP
jgi:hypothetical protein